MIKQKALLLVANTNTNGKYVTEGACKNIIEKFKKLTTPILITGLNQKIPIGKVIDLYYDEERKAVIGELEISINFMAGCKVLQDLQTPQGTTILECDIVNIIMEIKSI